MKLQPKYLLVAVLLFSGCGVWNDFTTYFNLYYNLSTAFEQAETSITENRKDLFKFKQEKLDSKTNGQLNDVIEKGSKILQFNSESSYFDDALFITGKAFFYQEDFLKALRKFKELQTRNNEDYNLEVKLWIGKTELQLRDFDKGMNTLDEFREEAIQNDRKDLAADAITSQVSYWIYRDNYLTAIEYCKDLIEVLEEPEDVSAVYYEIGRLYKDIENYEEAANAFRLAGEFEPSFEVGFNSQMELGRIESKLGNYDKAVEIFDQLKEEGKYVPFFDQIDLETANIKYVQGDYDEAMVMYTDIDSTYKNSPSAGEAAFKMSRLYADYYQNYDSANVYNEKVLSSKADEETVRAARSLRPIFDKYFDYRKDLKKYDRDFLYLTDTTLFVSDSIYFAAKVDSINKAKEEGEVEEPESRTARRSPAFSRRDVGSNAGNPQAVKLGDGKELTEPKMPDMTMDTLKTRISDTYYDLANLFFTEFNVRDSARYYYILSLDKYPGSTRYKSKAMFALGNYYLSVENKEKADSLFTYLYENYPNTDIANEAAKKLGKPVKDLVSDPLQEQYLAAEKLYESSDYEDAIDEYLNIYKFNPGSKYAAKALYTVGFIYENDLEDPEKAYNYYDTLVIKYKNNDYSNAVKDKVQYYDEEQKFLKQKEEARLDSIEAANKIELPDTTDMAINEDDVSKPDSLQAINEKDFPADSLSHPKTEAVKPDSSDGSGAE